MKKISNIFEYNSPVVLTFSLLAALVFILDKIIPVGLIQNFFVYFGGTSLLDFARLFIWPLGHASTDHLLGNMTYILLVGPMIEEKYSSKILLTLMVMTTLVIGLVQALFVSGGILGASGIVFMLIILTSFTNMKEGKIPLTFVAIAFLFLGKEIYNGIFVNNNVSEMGHILGALVGISFVLLEKKFYSNKSM